MSLWPPDHLGPVSYIAQLARLGEPRTAGILTDAEFESEKAKLLAR